LSRFRDAFNLGVSPSRSSMSGEFLILVSHVVAFEHKKFGRFEFSPAGQERRISAGQLTRVPVFRFDVELGFRGEFDLQSAPVCLAYVIGLIAQQVRMLKVFSNLVDDRR
jgi:hypothetical protein